MRRPLAHLAEVVRRAHDAFAEMMLPDAIDHHARGQRVLARGKPLGEPAAAPAGLRVGRRLREMPFGAARDREDAGLHRAPFCPGLPRCRKYDGVASRPASVTDIAAAYGSGRWSSSSLIFAVNSSWRVLSSGESAAYSSFASMRERLLHLVRVQLLALGALLGRRAKRKLDVVGQLRLLLGHQAVAIRLLELLDLLLPRSLQAVDALLFLFELRARLPRRPADTRAAWPGRRPPACGSNPSAESDRTCGCGSGRSRP